MPRENILSGLSVLPTGVVLLCVGGPRQTLRGSVVALQMVEFLLFFPPGLWFYFRLFSLFLEVFLIVEEQSSGAWPRHCAVRGRPAELPKIWLACVRETQQVVVVMAGFVDGYVNHFLLPIT